jgi:hypothetical protein
MSLVNANALVLAAGGDYQISRSVRLRSSASAYFNRTLTTPTSGTTWTWSAWVKRGVLSVESQLFSAGASVSDQIFFQNSTDVLIVYLGANTLVTSQVFRDPSSWYHIVLQVDTTQATASNRVRLYVNGVQVTAFSSTSYPTQNATTKFNSASAHNIGRYQAGASGYFDGYLTEINFIDGQALTPSSFGETSPVTGVWQPKKYTGTYGTNGFYLNFSDNSNNTAATIGKDSSGNGNNWTPNNISVTAGSTYDSMLDVPTLWADGGNGRGNYAVLNRLNTGNATVSQGNLNTFAGSAVVGTAIIPATTGIDSGKFYFEAVVASLSGPGGGTLYGLGVLPASFTQTSSASNLLGDSGKGWGYFQAPAGVVSGNPAKRTGGTNTAVGTGTLSSGDVFMCAVDMSNGYIWFGKNGTWAEGSPSAGTTPSFTGLTGPVVPALANYYDASNSCNLAGNFGQRPFSYTPPTGFKALNTGNLPDSTIVQGNKWMDATIYTGTGATQTITNSGSMQPDFVWAKSRSSAESHRLEDSVRGATQALYSNLTNAETTEAQSITAFNSGGFTLGTGTPNTSAVTYVAWQWKASGTTVTNTNGSITSTVSVSTTAGFSVLRYTGTGAAATVGHGLGVTPQMVIVKRRDSGPSSWTVWHNSFSSIEYIYLNLTNSKSSSAGSTVWNSTLPTSSVFSLGTYTDVNASGGTYVAYLFAPVAGYSAFGSYTGNGSADGPFVFTGFLPRWVLIKRTDSTSAWLIVDTSRQSYNVQGPYLVPNSSDAETTGTTVLDIVSNGFKSRSSSTLNTNGGTYIYAAFAQNPFKYALAR